jgi:hypothetical protein
VATGYYNLANVINPQVGDLIKAEMIVRESLRIRTRKYGNDHNKVGLSCSLLARNLILQDKLGNETMELFECLADNTKHSGPDGSNTAASNANLDNFYYDRANKQQDAQKRIEYLCLSTSKFEEAVRIYTNKILNLNIIYLCIYTYVYIYVYTYIYVYIYVYTYIYIYIYIYIYVYIWP